MKRAAWLGGGFVLVLCAMIVLLTRDVGEEIKASRTPKAPPAVESGDEGEERPAFVHANWDTTEPAPENEGLEEAPGLPDEQPPAWAERLKGVEVARVPRGARNQNQRR